MNLWRRVTGDPTLRDRTAAVAWFVLGLALLQFGAWPLWRSIALIETNVLGFLGTLTLAALTIRFRARAPFAQLLVMTGILAIDLLLGASLGVMLIFTDSVFSAVRYGSERGLRTTVGAAMSLAAATVLLLIIVRPRDPVFLIVVVQVGLLITISGAWGWSVRSEHERTRARMSQAHAAADLATRRRVAHDLHDLVANHIAVAALHVEAAKLRVGRMRVSDTTLIASLEQAKRGTDLAHAELRALIALLTEAAPPQASGWAEPAPFVDELQSMLPEGREITWRTNAGEALASVLTQLPEQEQRLLMRVLREIVTNAVKHGEGDICVSIGEAGADHDTLTLVIENATRPENRGTSGNGLGIEGVTSLLAGIGGSLTSHRRETTWCTRLTLPRDHHAEKSRP